MTESKDQSLAQQTKGQQSHSQHPEWGTTTGIRTHALAEWGRNPSIATNSSPRWGRFPHGSTTRTFLVETFLHTEVISMAKWAISQTHPNNIRLTRRSQSSDELVRSG